MTGTKAILRRPSTDTRYGFVVRHIAFYQPVDNPTQATESELKPLYALIILNVEVGSVADGAGLQAGHRIVEMNGHLVRHLTYDDVCRISERLQNDNVFTGHVADKIS
uniref:PDZ domain-containing protein n=1 Tax=Setaria digitata TaxID=48799 RepID=A0A915Q0T6_9BILA